MTEYLIQGETLTAIAEAIRGNNGTTDTIAVADMAAQIANISVSETEEIVIGESDGATPLNFSDGSQVVNPSAEGKVISKVVIEQPANLIPENIAEGVTIAGIVGTLAAGGSDIKIAYGEGTATGAAQTVTHNLGVKPDIVVVFGQLKASTSGLYVMLGLSAKAMQLANITKYAAAVTGGGSSSSMTGSSTKPMEENTTMIHSPAENTFVIDKFSSFSTYWFTKGVKIYWLAIGGLT